MIHNVGDVPTFVRRDTKSYIDITFTTKGIARYVKNWKVIERGNLRLHQHITHNINNTEKKNGQNQHKANKG